MSAAALVAALGWTLVHFVWQGALLGCAVAVLLTFLRNARPETRYAVACLGLLLCMAWPMADLALLLSAGDAEPAARLLPASGAARSRAMDPIGLLPWIQSRLDWIVVLWAACAGALGLRMVAGLLWIGRAVRLEACDPAWQARLTRMARDFGLDREVRLRVIDGLASPITAGWWRPVVLVPASLVTGMPPQLLEALLAHELGHVRRHDYLVNLGQNVIETLFFYHPAVWWISHRIRIEREQIADDYAARKLGEPRRLALALSELERLQFSTHHLAQAANGGDLMSRIKRLLRPDTQSLNWKAAIPVLGLAAMSMALFAQAAADPGPVTGAAGTQTPVLDFRSCAKPHYPKDELQRNHEGTVIMRFRVAPDGKVKEALVSGSSGFPALDEAARSALEKCSFMAGTSAGKPVESWATVQYVWTTK
ncbi:peptidase M56 [Massilia sp. WF1]|uniref:M56 family metallopeptidase n=1 Tax=unclassified Massilia TaxID=2609279 RepID=UPI00064B291B|nr:MULTISPECIES: M56 family metallopeptidase [unclassified Massilia]ALK97793.1 peptidase M56 [Massilia sp. WG5]KLU35454.1 peptidase M56 [Massilia sp. WF1]